MYIPLIFIIILIILLIIIFPIFAFLYLKNIKKGALEAKTSSKAISKFFTNISHEFRTPLNSIIGMIELLENGKLGVEEKKILEVLKKASNNLLSLINNILDISKIEAGKLKLENIQISIKKITEDTIQLLSPLAKKKNIALISQIDKSLSLNYGDPTRIQQILLNLIGNAIKFTEKGKVEVNIKLCDEKIITLRYPETTKQDMKHIDYLFIIIKDTGIGIPIDKWDDIFAAFSQAKTDTTRSFGGTGLGLAITRQIVKLIDGRIWVESFENIGTSFYLILPLKKIKNKSNISQNKFTISKKSNKKLFESKQISLRILLVEDNLDNQFLFQAHLKKTVHSLECANDGQEAVDFVKNKSFDLIFMDMQMPILNGISATKKIRQREIQKNKKEIPIYALSANVAKQEIENAKQAGCNGYIKKPYKKKRNF